MVAPLLFARWEEEIGELDIDDKLKAQERAEFAEFKKNQPQFKKWLRERDAQPLPDGRPNLRVIPGGKE